jgi:hypothetical protein
LPLSEIANARKLGTAASMASRTAGEASSARSFVVRIVECPVVAPGRVTGGETRSRRGLVTVKRLVEQLQKTTTQFLALLFGLPFFTFLVMALAQWGSGSSCHWQFPKWFGCVLGDHDSLAAGLIGATGALFAAWIAWTAVQRQLEEQQRQARIVERAYISGGGGPHLEHPNLFVLTVQNYGKKPGTVTAYAVSSVIRPAQPAYLEPGYSPTLFNGTYPPGGQTLGITFKEIPQSASNPIAYGRLWYRDVYGEYYFSFILPILTPHDHTDLVGISEAYTSST